MHKIELSIIIPVFNTEHFLEECILSVTKIKNLSYEIILVDDGSTDNSSQICKKYEMLFSDKIVYHHQKNRGLSVSRNVGIEMAQGRYLYFLDSDDYIDSIELEKACKYMNDENLDVVLFEGDSFVDENYLVKSLSKIKKQYKRTDNYSNHVYNGSKIVKKLLNNNDYYGSACLYLTRRKHILDNNIYFLENCIHEDEFFTPLNIFFSERIKITHLSVLKRRLRSGSIMASISKDQKKSIDCMIKVIVMLYAYKDLLEHSSYRRIIHILYGQILVKIYRNKELDNKDYLKNLKISMNKGLKLKMYQNPRTLYIHITAFYFPQVLKTSIKLIDYLKRFLH